MHTIAQHSRLSIKFLSNLILHHLPVLFLYSRMVSFLTVAFISIYVCLLKLSSDPWEDPSSFQFNFHLFLWQLHHIFRWLRIFWILTCKIHYALCQYFTCYKSYLCNLILILVLLFLEIFNIYLYISYNFFCIFYIP